MSDQSKAPPLDEKKQEATAILSQASNFIYINNTYAHASNWDIRLVFCERLPSGKPEIKAAICMSHSHAKALVDLLAKQVEGVEKAFGPIRFEPLKGSEGTED